MYPYLKNELAKRNVTMRQVSAEIGIKEAAFRYKLMENGTFSVDEVFAIKAVFFSTDPTPLEILFEKSDPPNTDSDVSRQRCDP